MPDPVGTQVPAGDNNDAEMDVDLAPEIVEGIQDEDTKNHLGTTIAQKNHWREKAKKEKEAFEAYKAKHPEAAPEQKPAAKKEKPGEFDPEAYKLQLREELRVEQKYPDISDAEMAKAKALAQVEGKSLMEVISDELFQAQMTRTREAQAADTARPTSSNRAGSSQSFSVADLADPAKVDAMDMKTYESLVQGKQNQLRGTLSKA